jgi:hypothetical protein
MSKKIELLAPAGNFLKMETALTHGADAVYLGIPDFSLRVRINDFNLKSLKEAVLIMALVPIALILEVARLTEYLLKTAHRMKMKRPRKHNRN